MKLTERQRKALEYVDVLEGRKLTRDPQDKGGPTKFGLTEKLAKKYGIKNIATVTQEEAQRVFILEFWNPKLNYLDDDRVAIKVFELGVHAGPTKPVMILQLALGDVGFDVEPDGKLGPLTTKAANTADQEALLKAFCNRQEKFYRAIGKKDPSQMKYIVAEDGGEGGWISRARKVPQNV